MLCITLKRLSQPTLQSSVLMKQHSKIYHKLVSTTNVVIDATKTEYLGAFYPNVNPNINYISYTTNDEYPFAL